MTINPLLIADIGGTNARFALAIEAPPYFNQAQTLQCADFENVEQAIDAYLKSQNIDSVQGMYLAVAAPILHESARMTNNHWILNRSDLRKRYATNHVELLNDFESIAYSLSLLQEPDLCIIGSKTNHKSTFGQNFTMAVLGPGSGLGIAGLCQRGATSLALTTEGGHVGFAPDNPLQLQLLKILRRKFGRVSNERLLSGAGLVNIYRALCEIDGQKYVEFSPADIAIAAQSRTDPICMQCMASFFEILGQVAGDTALALGAYQGIFIAGGITQRYPELLVQSNFRAGFENKGRHGHIMQGIPTWLITHNNPGLIGSSVYARSCLQSIDQTKF